MSLNIRNSSRPPRSSGPSQSRRAVLAGWAGSTLEYYDMFIYAAAAALVFDRVFWSSAGDLSLLVSLATIGVQWVVRPFGALLWGHYGDRLSRKQVLVLTLILMGVATFCMGLIPSYASIGVAAPILLTLTLVLRGLSVAGEKAGAATLVVEASDNKNRGVNSSWIETGALCGFILATLIFIPVAALPEDILFTWGWRIPFLLSFVLVVFALVIRVKLEDPEVFKEQKMKSEVSLVAKSSPLLTLFKEYKLPILQVTALSMFQGTHQMVTVFGLAYATSFAGIPRTTMLTTLLIVSVISLVTLPLGGWMADKWGRKRVFAGGAITCASAFFLFAWVIFLGDTLWIIVTAILIYSFGYSVGNGSTMALFAEQFPVQVRYSGVAISLQLAGLVYGFAPSIALFLLRDDPARWPYAAMVQVALCVAALIACWTVKETAWTPIAEIKKHDTKQEPAKR